MSGNAKNISGFFAMFYPFGKEQESLAILFADKKSRDWFIKERPGFYPEAIVEKIAKSKVTSYDFYEEIENSYPEWFSYEE